MCDEGGVGRLSACQFPKPTKESTQLSPTENGHIAMAHQQLGQHASHPLAYSNTSRRTVAKMSTP